MRREASLLELVSIGRLSGNLRHRRWQPLKRSFIDKMVQFFYKR